jgi:hypothetical protein
MSTALSALLIFIGVGIGVWLFSFVMEALRPAPRAPQKLRWAPDLPIEHVDIGSNILRYTKTGRGPNLVLLHTLRDRKLIPNVQMTTLERGGHFLPLDRPEELTQSIIRFAAEKPAKVGSR